jgi:hypothetical protein
MEAFNRLDNTAEGWWRYYYTPGASSAPYSDLSDLNGFYIRDDVPKDFGDQIVNGDDDSKIKITYKRNPAYSKVWTIKQMDKKQLVIYCDSIQYTLN